MNVELSPIETDLLTEVLNIGVGHAAASLSQLVQQEIALSVPEIEFKKRDEFALLLGPDRNVCGISQTLSGPFEAESILLFAEENSLSIVKEMLGKEISDEQLTDLQQEALVEIGNIVLNACIGGISKTLGETIIVELPQFDVGSPHEVLHCHDNEDMILFMKIELSLKRSAIRGYMAFILQPTSLIRLKQSLTDMFHRMTGIGTA